MKCLLQQYRFTPSFLNRSRGVSAFACLKCFHKCPMGFPQVQHRIRNILSLLKKKKKNSHKNAIPCFESCGALFSDGFCDGFNVRSRTMEEKGVGEEGKRERNNVPPNNLQSHFLFNKKYFTVREFTEKYLRSNRCNSGGKPSFESRNKRCVVSDIFP